VGLSCSQVSVCSGNEILRELDPDNLLEAKAGCEKHHPSQAGTVINESGRGIDWLQKSGDKAPIGIGRRAMAAALRIGWIKNGVPFRRPDVESVFLKPLLEP
jgi:hypothetical protein